MFVKIHLQIAYKQTILKCTNFFFIVLILLLICLALNIQRLASLHVQMLPYMYKCFLTCSNAFLHVQMLPYMYKCFLTCTNASLHVQMLPYMYKCFLTCSIVQYSFYKGAQIILELKVKKCMYIYFACTYTVLVHILCLYIYFACTYTVLVHILCLYIYCA